MNLDDLHEISYRGAQFFMKSSDIEGGRKDVLKEFVGSDRQVIEDLGLKRRVYSVEGKIGARRDNAGRVLVSYDEVRSSLLAALELGGVGVLIHPFYGRLENMAARNFNLNESLDSLGMASITITFGVSDIDGTPVASTSSLIEILAQREVVAAATTADMTNNFTVDTSFTGNFQDALDKISEFIDQATSATSSIEAISSEVNKFSHQLSQMNANAAALVNVPKDLIDQITGVFDTMAGMYSTADGAFEAIKEMLTFGDTDVSFSHHPPTVGKLQREENRDRFNTAVKASSLGYLYEEASQVTFTTEDDIEETSDELEVAYQDLVMGGLMADDVYDTLTDLREKAQAFFDEQKLNTSQILTVNTNPTSARLLAYQYYGSDDLGISIAELNGLHDSAFINGDVRIFSS